MDAFLYTPAKLCSKCGKDYTRESFLNRLDQRYLSDIFLHAWKALAYGCPKHPRYRASGTDTVPTCPSCLDLFNYRKEIESLEVELGRKARAAALAEREQARRESEQLERYAESHQ